MFGLLIIDEGPPLSMTAGPAVPQLLLVCSRVHTHPSDVLMSFFISTNTKINVCWSVGHASRCNGFIKKGMYVAKTTPFHLLLMPRRYSLVADGAVSHEILFRLQTHDKDQDDLWIHLWPMYCSEQIVSSTRSFLWWWASIQSYLH